MDPAAFLRGRAWPPGLLCCDPAAAWLEANGLPLPPIVGRARDILARFGALRGAALAARALGLARIDAPEPGDIVVAESPLQGPLIGLCCGPMTGFVSRSGNVFFVRATILAAWRPPWPSR